MTKQCKHIRLQVAHKAAQMMAEEGICDYAFAKRKAAKFFRAIDRETLPSNDEINDAIKEYQSIFFDNDHEAQLKKLRLEALSLMKKLNGFNPRLSGGVFDGTAGKYPTTHIHLYVDSMKEIEFFLLNHNISYEISDRKLHGKYLNKDKKMIPILKLEGLLGPIELLIYHTEDLKINKPKGSVEEIEALLKASHIKDINL